MATKCELCGNRHGAGRSVVGVVFFVCLSLVMLAVGLYAVYEKFSTARAPIEAERHKAHSAVEAEKVRADNLMAVEKLKSDTALAVARANAEEAVRQSNILQYNRTMQERAAADRAKAEADKVAFDTAKLEGDKVRLAAEKSFNEAQKAKAEAERAKADAAKAEADARTADAREREVSRREIYRTCMASINDPSVCSGEKVQVVRCLSPIPGGGK